MAHAWFSSVGPGDQSWPPTFRSSCAVGMHGGIVCMLKMSVTLVSCVWRSVAFIYRNSGVGLKNNNNLGSRLKISESKNVQDMSGQLRVKKGLHTLES